MILLLLGVPALTSRGGPGAATELQGEFQASDFGQATIHCIFSSCLLSFVLIF